MECGRGIENGTDDGTRMPDAPPADGASPRAPLLQEFAAALGTPFQDLTLLDQALTHASSTADPLADNERLEFFGDAILDFLVGEELFRQCPDRDEGWLTQAKSAIVCRESLAEAGEALGVRPYLLLGRGIGQRKELPASVYANAYEALVAAVYLDAGMDAARTFVRGTLGDALDRARELRSERNYKSLLQEWLQKRDGSLPLYHTVGETGPEHAKTFRVTVQVDGKVIAEGTGGKKRDAEQDAARVALQVLLPHDPPPVDDSVPQEQD